MQIENEELEYNEYDDEDYFDYSRVLRGVVGFFVSMFLFSFVQLIIKPDYWFVSGMLALFKEKIFSLDLVVILATFFVLFVFCNFMTCIVVTKTIEKKEDKVLLILFNLSGFFGCIFVPDGTFYSGVIFVVFFLLSWWIGKE